MQDTTPATVASSAAAFVSGPTPLAQALGGDAETLQPLAGALSFPVFSLFAQELDTLIKSVGIFDLGYRTQIAVGGSDRLRWLNGMLTGNIQGLPENAGCYNFVLNAQGRIQGDCDAYRIANRLLVVTDRAQSPMLAAHFDHFIIMDDVIVEDISSTRTALGLAGPQAPGILAALGVPALPAAGPGALWLQETRICGVSIQLTGGHPGPLPRFELWCANEDVRMLWDVLLAAGAVPCGLQAAEALRVLSGIPRYGVDITGRDLPQETSQMRALHFAKGCYLGQEIVERIRSRGQVRRQLALFTLSSEPEALPLELTAPMETAPVARITSTAFYQGTRYGLGIARSEVLERHSTLEYPGGVAARLAHSPFSSS